MQSVTPKGTKSTLSICEKSNAFYLPFSLVKNRFGVYLIRILPYIIAIIVLDTKKSSIYFSAFCVTTSVDLAPFE